METNQIIVVCICMLIIGVIVFFIGVCVGWRARDRDTDKGV